MDFVGVICWKSSGDKTPPQGKT